MKLWERIIGQTFRVGTNDAIFVISPLCEKYRKSNMPLDMVFVDLQKKNMTPYLEKCYGDARGKEHPGSLYTYNTGHVSRRYHVCRLKVKTSDKFEGVIGLRLGSALSLFM